MHGCLPTVPHYSRVTSADGQLLQAGRLSQISRQAAINTDVYIFRESTGELLVEVRGLPKLDGAGERRLVDDGRAYTWNTVIQGPRTTRFIGGSAGLLGARDESDQFIRNIDGFNVFSEAIGVPPRFQGQKSGIPGPGEQLRIVAINRTTGYTGTATMTLGDAATGDNTLFAGSINQVVPKITLTPPNLKIWARRLSTIEHGLTADEQAEFLIGHEGAATRDDTLIAVFSEWLDEDDKPLPDGLGTNKGQDFGLTGRLAKLSGGQLSEVNTGTAVDPDSADLEALANGQDAKVAEFGIGPGRRAQLLRLKADNRANEHFYINVFGRAKNQEACPHCDHTGSTHQGTLQGRPTHYTPIRVPRFDEEATLALRQERARLRREQAENNVPEEERAGAVDSQYQWLTRPEYQFSVIELMINELQAVRLQEDENGEQTEVIRNLLAEEALPILSKHDDLLRIFHQLTLPEEDPLPGFDGPARQYVLSFAEDEQPLEITLGTNGLEFDAHSIEVLDRLINLTSPSDLLTLRVFLNSDPGNVLWQWAFVKNGLRVEFEHPAEKILLKPRISQENPAPGEEGYYTLGGARLRLSYDFPPGSTPLYLRLYVNQPGYTCPTFYSDRRATTGTPCMSETARFPIGSWQNPNPFAGNEVAEDWFVYWEPEQWVTTLDGQISVEVGYIQAQRALIEASWNLLPASDFADQNLSRVSTEPMQVWLRSRVLRPDASPQQQGSDVRLLEAMLWQLGLSPQKGFPGEQGNRIDSVRSNGKHTQTCNNQRADRRDVYYPGWPGCASGQVSTEAMVRRFKARSFSAAGINADTIDGITGSLDTPAVQHLGLVWQDYVKAAAHHGEAEVSPTSVPDAWWQQLAVLAANGGDIPYRDTPAGLSYGLQATYTDTLHEQITGKFPKAAAGITAKGLFRAWSEQETGGKVWGNTGFPRTAYRIHEGSGDEEGSMGFNHILWKRMYGLENSCLSNRGYRLKNGQVNPDGSGRNINLYDPFNSLMAFLAGASDEACTFSNGLYRAYLSQKSGKHYRIAIPEVDRPLSYCYEQIVGSANGNSCIADPATWLPYTLKQDSGYQLLGKAIIAYNQGAGADRLERSHYFTNLKGRPRRNNSGNFDPTHFGYWLGVKDKSWELQSEIGGYLPYVSYVWVGERQPPTINDGQGNTIANPNAGEPVWCFAYGEREWRAGESFSVVELRANGNLNVVPPVQPQGRIDCLTGAPL